MKHFRFLCETLIAAGVTVSLRKFASPLHSFVGKRASYHCKTTFSQCSVVSEAENDHQQPAAFFRCHNNLAQRFVLDRRSGCCVLVVAARS